MLKNAPAGAFLVKVKKSIIIASRQFYLKIHLVDKVADLLYGLMYRMAKKVLFIERCDGRYIPPTTAGRELNSSWHIARYLKQYGVDVGILSSQQDGSDALTLQCASNDPHDVALQIMREKPDVVLVSSWIELVQELENFLGIKMIVLRGMRSLKNVIRHKDALNKGVDKVIAVSNAQAEELRKVGLRDGLVVVIPNAVNKAVFTRKNKTRRQRHTLIYAGALAPEKGIDVLLKAFQKLYQRYGDAELIVCGSESIYGLKDNYVGDLLQNTPGVNFLGLVGQARLAHLLLQASFCIVPTNPNLIFETFSKITHEAQYMGCIPVVSSSGCLPSLIQEGVNGFIFNPYSEEDLYTKVCSLFEKNQNELEVVRSRMMSLAEKEVKDWSDIAKIYHGMIESL